MAKAAHIINKQVFEFECSQTEHAFQMQNKMGLVLQDKIAAAIERVCDRVSNDSDNILIPFLEIDIGEISFDRMEIEITDVIEKKFYEKLLQQKLNYPGRTSVEYSKKETSFEIIKTFLLTGKLPWFAGKQDETYFAELFAGLFSVSKDELKSLVLQNLFNEKFIERLASGADTSLVTRVIEALDLDKDLLYEVELEISKIISETTSRLKRFPGKEIRILEFESFAKGKAEVINDIIENILDFFSKDDKVASHQLRKIAFEFLLKLISKRSTYADTAQFYELIKKMIAEKFGFDPNIFEITSLKEISYSSELFTAVANEKIKIENESLTNKDDPALDDTIAPLKYYISNAGLVLLAHYLPLFFGELGYLEQGDFVNDHDKIRAVFLLYYLCTGKEETAEYILPLNKILCGLSLDEPLPGFVALSEKEKNECDELLEEIINNWQRLGNSSIEGLREAFLNRDGILSFENNVWKLQIERKGYDVLLDALPWSFNHIKLSWMQNLILTEW